MCKHREWFDNTQFDANAPVLCFEGIVGVKAPTPANPSPTVITQGYGPVPFRMYTHDRKKYVDLRINCWYAPDLTQNLISTDLLTKEGIELNIGPPSATDDTSLPSFCTTKLFFSTENNTLFNT